MQVPENDSDAFFRFSLGFPCLFAFLRQNAYESVSAVRTIKGLW